MIGKVTIKRIVRGLKRKELGRRTDELNKEEKRGMGKKAEEEQKNKKKWNWRRSGECQGAEEIKMCITELSNFNLHINLIYRFSIHSEHLLTR